jgi:hypothetical protein
VLADPARPLPPEFADEFLPEAYTRNVVATFLDVLAKMYEEPDGLDRCTWFTDAGWEAALQHDWRLRNAIAGETALRQEHVLRVAFESVNEPRGRPPRLEFDPIYDIPAGATTVDIRTGRVRTTSTGIERTGMHVGFVFDGRRWLVDGMGPLSTDYAPWLILPTPPPAGPPCRDFQVDQGPRPFDENAGRPWCDGDGRGRLVAIPIQLTMLTKYPCERGRASVLTIGRPIGAAIDPLLRWEYVRDPLGEFLRNQWIREPYDGEASLPPSAAYTGWTNGNTELWIDPAELDSAIYVVRGDDVERWPRAVEGWGVIDCN